MLGRSTLDKIITILKKDCRRALRLRTRGFPRPYYCSFLMRDVEWFNTWASSGSVYRKRADRKRNVYCDIRIGSYRSDQTTAGGLHDNNEEADSINFVKVPIDDYAYDGLRMGLWRLTEIRYREALADYNNKANAQLSTVDPNRRYHTFTPQKKLHVIKAPKRERLDEERWVKFCKTVSKWMSELRYISANWVEFDASHETKIFVSSENRVIVQHFNSYMLVGGIRRVTKEGLTLEQEVVVNAASLADLPDLKSFKRALHEKYEKLMRQVRAKKIHAFSGPVLLYPGPAGVLFHEALGHRLEGSRLLSAGEGQTFKDQLGKMIIGHEITIRDNPLLKSFNGIKTVGSYEYDDEGTPARNTLLVDSGKLVNFLSSRAQLPIKNFVPNGHARNDKFQRPISRMGVTIIEGRRTESLENLRKLLLREIRRQKKPFGMIVYETSGGETETTSYDFQAFAGEISYATLIYPDGSEVCVRGVNFVGTPLQAISNIVAVGNLQELDNSYCAAESGYVPITTISPAVLLSSLELQAKDEQLEAPFILPKPRS